MGTDGSWTSARIRAALREHRQTAGGGGYPVGLRERAVRCAREMRARGLSMAEIATELGIMASTASGWSSSAKEGDDGERLSFVPVIVEGQEQVRAGQGRFEIAFPTGVVLRVEGVDRDAMSAAIAALSSRGQP
jgi:hypothetical protein